MTSLVITRKNWSNGVTGQKVWIVTAYDNDYYGHGEHILGIFSTEKGALEYVEQRDTEFGEGHVSSIKTDRFYVLFETSMRWEPRWLRSRRSHMMCRWKN